MMRSLWTAASGMMAQQTSVDTISNNLANVNTVGYKSESTEFKSLLYQNLQSRTTSANGEYKPVAAQVGLGARVASVTSHFTQGAMNASDSSTDFAISGDGLFAVQNEEGETVYTRNGNFLMAINPNGGTTLTTADGYSVLDSNGKAITFDAATDTTRLSFDNYGNIFYKNAQGVIQPTGVRIGAAQFNNPSGLTKLGDSYFAESAASGNARIEGQDAALSVSVIKNGYLEASSVQAVDEMVDMIVTQRAYEMNSKAITASDEMLQQANNLRS